MKEDLTLINIRLTLGRYIRQVWDAIICIQSHAYELIFHHKFLKLKLKLPTHR